MKEYEVVRHQGDATVYRLKGGRAEVTIHDKAAFTPDEILAKCVLAEQALEQDHRANRDLGERVMEARQTDAFDIESTAGGLTLVRGDRRFRVFDAELPALIAAARRRWETSYEKRKADLLEKVRQKGDDFERARDELQRLKDEDQRGSP